MRGSHVSADDTGGDSADISMIPGMSMAAAAGAAWSCALNVFGFQINCLCWFDSIGSFIGYSGLFGEAGDRGNDFNPLGTRAMHAWGKSRSMRASIHRTHDESHSPKSREMRETPIAERMVAGYRIDCSATANFLASLVGAAVASARCGIGSLLVRCMRHANEKGLNRIVCAGMEVNGMR